MTTESPWRSTCAQTHRFSEASPDGVPHEQVDGRQDPPAMIITPDRALADGHGHGHGHGHGRIGLWNRLTGKKYRHPADPESKGVESVAFSLDGKTVVAGDNNAIPFYGTELHKDHPRVGNDSGVSLYEFSLRFSSYRS